MRLGFLSKKNTRDLSKEIWISWGYDYDQEGGVYVNQINPGSTQQYIPLKNAKGDNTTLSLWQNDYYGIQIPPTTYSAGTLDIINRRENNLYYSYEEGFEAENSLTISTGGDTVSGEVYVLGSRTAMGVANQTYLSVWGQWSTPIPATVGYPVQTKMDVNDDWHKVEGVSTNVSILIYSSTEGHYAPIRAIVIKLI